MSRLGFVVAWRSITRRTSTSVAMEGVNDINSVLAKSRADSNRARIVLGNESADMDSIVCALVLAYSRTKASENVHVPVINIPRDDMRLRTDVEHLFREVGIDHSKLVFKDEIDLKKKDELSVVLVDHNKLSTEQQDLSDCVVEIIDHHVDENQYTSAKRLIDKTGSCTTLVAHSILNDDAQKSVLLQNKSACYLLTATILLDTVNHDENQKRSTDKDKTATKQLGHRWTKSELDDLYEQLKRAKFDQYKLSSQDLLRRDYKQWTLQSVELGISSTGLRLETWIDRDGKAILDDLKAYKQNVNCDVLIVMPSFFEDINDDGSFRRQLLIYSDDKELQRFLVERLHDSSRSLQLEPLALESAELSSEVAAFAQNNITVSRKKLQPMLAEILSERG